MSEGPAEGPAAVGAPVGAAEARVGGGVVGGVGAQASQQHPHVQRLHPGVGVGVGRAGGPAGRVGGPADGVHPPPPVLWVMLLTQTHDWHSVHSVFRRNWVVGVMVIWEHMQHLCL